VTSGLPVTKWVILLQPVEPASKFLRLRQWASQRGGEEGLRLQSQEVQDLSAAAAAEQLIFKTSTEKQTVHLVFLVGAHQSSYASSRMCAKTSFLDDNQEQQAKCECFSVLISEDIY